MVVQLIQLMVSLKMLLSYFATSTQMAQSIRCTLSCSLSLMKLPQATPMIVTLKPPLLSKLDLKTSSPTFLTSHTNYTKCQKSVKTN